MLQNETSLADVIPASSANAAPLLTIQASTVISSVSAVLREVAATELMPRFHRVAAERKHDGSIVTAADRAVEAALEAALVKIIDVPVLGEEMPLDMQKNIWRDAEWIWCVDPLDGTSNFANGKKYFGISVALMHRRRSVFGMVLDPNTNELFHAVQGAGAFMDGKKLHTHAAVRMCEAHLEIGRFKRLGRLQAALKANPPCKKFSMSGASVLQWCHLASSRIDTFLHAGEHPWDYAAGALILEEAGGRIASIEHDSYWRTSDPDAMWEQSVIAARHPALFEEWKRWVRQHY
jgi:myo-inositol-1(or 4)-monophosphatase